MALATMATAEEKRTPVIIDTDLGSDIDDAFALALAVASPEVELVGVTTVAGDTIIRAKMALRFLHAVGLPKVPVAAGAQPQPVSEITGQYQYYYHPAVLYNRAGQPQRQSAVEFLQATLAKRSDKLTIVALGPLTNIARLLHEFPDAKEKIERIIIMGGSLGRDYDGNAKQIAEWNIKTDIKAAQAVFASGVPLVIVPLDVTWNMRLNAAQRESLFAKKSMLTLQVEALYQMWNQSAPVLFDAVAVAALIDDDLCEWESLKLGVSDHGVTQVDEAGEPNARVAIKCDPQQWMKWYVARVEGWGSSSLPEKPRNETQLIDDDRFPAAVHVFEDFETDIEKRWWLVGGLQEKDAPPGSRRYLRSHLTLDFDDLQGQLNTMYNAVVFNPVPGPVMGPRTRLKFRYRLQGTDTLRVQLYSLSKGYHRYLSLTGLPQDQWRSATVDMTAARRPDGSGGALAGDERIDDIQFYVDPRAQVSIDDIILYDAGADEEKEPFPQRVIFVAGFDTGKQGQEWPGVFEIVSHDKPQAWRYAQSVLTDGKPSLLVGLRGIRILSNDARLKLRYRLSGKSAAIPVTIGHARHKGKLSTSLLEPPDEKWQTATVSFPSGAGTTKIDHIHLDVPVGATLSVDDLILFEP